MRLRFVYLIFMALMLIAIPAAAQESNENWFVYLFDSVNNDLIQVNQNGESSVFSLGLGENEFANQFDMTFSTDGSKVIFCKESRPDPNSSQPGMKTIIVRDIAAQTNSLELPLAPAYGCTVSALNADATQVAVGLVNWMPYSQETIPADLPAWSLQLLDIATGEVLHEVNSLTEGMPPFNPFGEDIPLLARVLEWTEETVTYYGLPYIGMDGPPSVPMYQWTLADNTVTLLEREYSFFEDVLPQTGERVLPTLDESLPAATPGGPLPQANTLTLTDASGTRPIYRNTDWIIVDAEFVNDGQAVAVQLLQGFNMDNPNDMSGTRYAIIDRAGSVTELETEYEAMSQIVPIPDGVAILWSDNPTEQNPIPAAHLSLVQDGVANEIWSYTPPADAGFSFVQLAWSPSVTTEDELPPFTAVP